MPLLRVFAVRFNAHRVSLTPRESPPPPSISYNRKDSGGRGDFMLLRVRVASTPRVHYVAHIQ